MSHSKHSVDNQHVILWNLIKTLVKAFGLVNLLKHSLFKNSSQLDYEVLYVKNYLNVITLD